MNISSIRIEDISIVIPLFLSIGFGIISYFVFPFVQDGYEQLPNEEGEDRRSNRINTKGLAALKYFTVVTALLAAVVDLYFALLGRYQTLFLCAAVSWLVIMIASGLKLHHPHNAGEGGHFSIFCTAFLLLTVQFQLAKDWAPLLLRGNWMSIAAVSVCVLNASLVLTIGFWKLRSEQDDQDQLSPEIGASILSQLTFSWINPMIDYGNNFPLEKTDMKILCPQENANDILKEYQAMKNPAHSLGWRIIKMNSLFIVYQWICCAVFTILSFAAPYYLYQVVDALQTPGLDRIAVLPFLIKLFMFSIIQSLVGNQQFFVGRRVGNRSRIIVLDELFGKSLRRAYGISSSVSEEGDDQASLGKIVTLMSVDAQRVQELGSYSHYFLINLPISIIISITSLYFVIGWSSFVGVGIVLLLGPISHFLGAFFIKAQEELLTFTDSRVTLMNELLQGIRIIKYFAWEDSFMEKVNVARAKELASIKKLFLANISFGAVSRGTSILISFCTFYTYVMIAGHELDAATAFTAVALLNVVRQSMTELPHAILTIFKTKVSLERISKFLEEQEIQLVKGEADEDGADSDAETVDDEEGEKAFGFHAADFRFFGTTDASAADETTNSFSLRNLNISFPKGKLTLIAGPTAAGKTGLLLSLLGELETLKGSYKLSIENEQGFSNTVAYAAQSAWLLNATIRDNILFGGPYDAERYQRVVECCSLVKDFQNLDGGDLTEIGEKGINVSGGQKQRISLARACYSKSYIVFLDDPLSAVDAPTARFLLHRAILDLLRGRTVILVSHATHLVVPFADYIVSLKNGEVFFQGSPQEATQSVNDESLYGLDLTKDEFEEDEKEIVKFTPTLAGDGQVLVEDEEKSTGAVAWSVYKMYFVASGGILFVIMFLAGFALLNSARVANDWWLTVWTNQNAAADGNVSSLSTFSSSSSSSAIFESMSGANALLPSSTGVWYMKALSPSQASTMNALSHETNAIDTMYYLCIYAALGIAVIFAGVIEDLVMLTGALWASKKLHSEMLHSVLRAPLRFFEVTPIGRVLNRFSRDLDCVDSQAIYSVQYFMECAIQAMTVIIVIGSIAPAVLVVVPLIALAFLSVSIRYLNASRELKRLESVTRSPIFSQFSEVLSGICTVRAYKAESRFLADNRKKINDNQEPFYFMWVANRWLCLRTEFLSAVVVFSAGLSIIFLKSINAGWAALMIVYAINLTDALLFSVRLHADMEMSMNSVERVQEYCALEPEAPATIESNRPADAWPQKGAIDVRDLSLRYSEELPDVLKNVSFSVKPGEKVAVVGRTGAGKSTLSLAFFRIIPQSSGCVIIDGEDISKLGLYDLRSRLTIIPQDPVLFQGTLRTNLDPLSQNDDASIWDALERVHFIESMQQKSSEDLAASTTTLASESSSFSLDLTVSENGSNFSQGQRQLLCLARSILQRNKIIFLDEATASVDNETDAKIQDAIRTEFKSSTIICIAHRLKTVIDYDKVLVLDKGQVIEYGTPYELMINSKVGVFRSMCDETGHCDELLEIARNAVLNA